MIMMKMTTMMMMMAVKKIKLTSLPAKEKFYSSLDDSHISEEDYKTAVEGWNVFDCQTLEDYLIKYCTIDVLLLADCFESFRKECLYHYELDPAYCVSLPGFTFEAFLWKSKVELEHLNEADIYQFFELSIRGGITLAVKRHVKANTSKIEDTFDPAKKPVSLLYIDANNLYGWAMMQKLPEKNFKFEDEKKFSTEYILNLPEDGDTGY